MSTQARFQKACKSKTSPTLGTASTTVRCISPNASAAGPMDDLTFITPPSSPMQRSNLLSFKDIGVLPPAAPLPDTTDRTGSAEKVEKLHKLCLANRTKLELQAQSSDFAKFKNNCKSEVQAGRADAADVGVTVK